MKKKASRFAGIGLFVLALGGMPEPAGAALYVSMDHATYYLPDPTNEISITIEALTDSGAEVTNVDVYANVDLTDQLLGTATLESPGDRATWKFAWASPPLGENYLRAIAQSAQGNATSSYAFITVTDSNRPPTVASLSGASVVEGSTVTLSPAVSAPESSQTVSLRTLSAPALGTVTHLQNGQTPSLRYTAYTAVTGTDTFSVVANDGYADSAPATITITVKSNSPPIVESCSGRIDPGQTNRFRIHIYDANSAIQPVSMLVDTTPQQGSVWYTNGYCYYLPTNAYVVAGDSFSFRATDGIATSGMAACTLTYWNPNVWTSVPPYRSHSLGLQKCLIIGVDFPDLAPRGSIDAASWMANAQPSDDWIRQESLYQTGLKFTVVTNRIMMPKPTTSYPNQSYIVTQMLDALAQAQKINPFWSATYFDRVWMADAVNLEATGLALVNSAYLWIGLVGGTKYKSHELMHTYGLNHEDQGINNPSRYYDLGSHVTLHSRLMRLDWMDREPEPHGRNVSVVQTSGVYRLRPYDQLSSLPGASRGLLFLNGADEKLLIGCKSQMRGALAYTYGSAGAMPTQIDTTPATVGSIGDPAGWDDGHIEVGMLYSNATLGVTVETVADTGSYIDLRVTFPGDTPIDVTPTNLLAASLADAPIPGLGYRYYDGTWSALPNFDALNASASGRVDSISAAHWSAQRYFGLVLEGFIEAPVDGLYTFELTANDAAELKVDGMSVTQFDSRRTSPATALGSIALAAGKHALRLNYFHYDAADNETPVLGARWGAPGLPMKAVLPLALSSSGNPLVANAGIDRNEEGLRPLSLDGSSSLNLGTGTVQYSWTQIANGAPAATLSNATQAVASFLPSAAGLYTFGLTLASGAYTNTDSVSVNVSVDSTPPHVLSAVGNADQSRVVVTFSEPVAESSATHPLSYSVDGGVTVLSATLTDGGTRVTLRTSPLAGGTTYHLSFVGILDRATVPNALTPGTSVEVSVPVPVGGRLPLTFSGHTGAALTNFPSLVVLGPAITNFGYGAFISPHGHDLRFWNDEETTQLAYEIESWGAAGDTNSQVWVSVPVLTNGTRLYATWGNPAETNRQAWSTNGIVWGSRYKGVWHMGETNAQDSSPQASHGTSRGNTAAAGVIGTAQYFNRAGSNHVRLANGGSFDLNEASVSFWFRGTNEMGCGIFGVGRDDATNTNHQCEISIGQNRTANYTNELVTHIHRDLSNTAYDHVSHTNADRSLLFDGAWHHVALTFSGLTNGTKIYLDGASRASSIVGADTGRFGITHMSPPANVAVLGGRYTTNFVNFLEGHLDEVRVADLARSPDWIRAEFLSVASNRTFLSYGAVIVQPAADGDGDGLPDGWELQYGGTNRFGAGESDYDHDGMDDTAEYIAGTVPTNKASVFSVSPGTHTGGLFVLTWESASGRLYRVYGATNLIAAPVEWELLPGTDGLIGTGWPMSYTSFPQQAAGFYRIDVRRLE
jgi:hypothetical protein